MDGIKKFLIIFMPIILTITVLSYGASLIWPGQAITYLQEMQTPTGIKYFVFNTTEWLNDLNFELSFQNLNSLEDFFKGFKELNTGNPLTTTVKILVNSLLIIINFIIFSLNVIITIMTFLGEIIPTLLTFVGIRIKHTNIQEFWTNVTTNTIPYFSYFLGKYAVVL